MAKGGNRHLENEMAKPPKGLKETTWQRRNNSHFIAPSAHRRAFRVTFVPYGGEGEEAPSARALFH